MRLCCVGILFCLKQIVSCPINYQFLSGIVQTLEMHARAFRSVFSEFILFIMYKHLCLSCWVFLLLPWVHWNLHSKFSEFATKHSWGYVYFNLFYFANKVSRFTFTDHFLIWGKYSSDTNQFPFLTLQFPSYVSFALNRWLLLVSVHFMDCSQENWIDWCLLSHAKIMLQEYLFFCLCLKGSKCHVK